ncbi:Short chain dehydrogenase family protein [Hondaea fermentalgiana]|uniref:Short chain dehydrogenase family protein n=1 Tax=Hondaea fermentalgiana TaxID=2315210 RepID=A0A2R5G7J8_9STRA|nr:Short chain dehydrogenase family protein [Hondaea fermentalgiana]|eukprot:GBG27026.1 Short chain dehydrogenase family protein [Hondaea fermentalgiana]
MGSGYTKPEKETKWFDKELQGIPSLDGKVVVVTGTTSGTGRVRADALAQKNAKVVMLNRKSERSEKCLKELRETYPEADISQVECDLMSFASVREAAKKVNESLPKINSLVLNAGVMALDDVATTDGYDQQMQVNVLSQFLLFKELFPLLTNAEREDGQARVVQHSSIARFGGPLEAKYMEKNGGALGGNGSGMMMNGPRWKRYQQTKLGVQVSAYAIADKMAEMGHPNILALVAHPGLSATSLQETTVKNGGMGNFFTKIFMSMSQSPQDGTCGLLHATAATDVQQKGFYGPGAKVTAMKGPAESIPVEKKADDKEQKALFWSKMEEAFGAFEA